MKINERIHTKSNGKYFPKKTNVDMYVFKVMKVIQAGSENGEIYETPSMFLRLKLNQLNICTHFEKYTHDDKTFIGYNAFTNQRHAQQYIDQRDCTFEHSELRIFNAVIPRDSLYYVGPLGQIISNKIKIINKI